MKTKNVLILLIFFMTIGKGAIAQRAMYVNDFATILNSQAKQHELLTYACLNNFKTLLFYNLHTISNTHNGLLNSPLKAFIHMAKTQYGVSKVGAIAENPNFFTNVVQPYNISSSTSATEKFDIYLTEFEYWVTASTDPGGYLCTTYLNTSTYGCNTAGAFKFLKDMLTTMNTLATANTHPVSVEVYLGNGGVINGTQCQDLVPLVDLVRLTGYTSNYSAVYNNTDGRLDWFGSNTGNVTVPVSIIISSEVNFMQSYLNNNSILQAEQEYHSDYAQNLSLAWKNYIDVKDFTYFTYTEMYDPSKSINVTLNHQNWIVMGYNCALFDPIHDHGHDPILTPMPASTNLNIFLPDCYVGQTDVNIYNFNGEVVLTENYVLSPNTTGHHETIDVSNLLPGLYILQVSDGLHGSISEQIIIE